MNPTVVIDSNILHTPRTMESRHWKWLVGQASNGQFTIAIPEVVKSELDRQYCSRLKELHEKIDKYLSELSRYTQLSAKWIDAKPSRYEIDDLAIIDSFIQENSMKLLKLPTVPHSHLLRRDLEQRKPFSLDGRGYRDSLIWHTIIDHLLEESSSNEVYFISNNGKDFAKDDNLHPSLKSEVPDGCKVTLYNSIWSFKEDFEARPAEWLGGQALADEFNDTPRNFDFAQAVESHISEQLSRSSVEDIPWLKLNSQLFDVELVDHVVQFAEEHLVESLDDNTSIYNIEFEVDLELRAMVDIEDYHEVSGSVDLEDSSSNPQYVIVSSEERASGILDMRLEADRETYEFL